MIQFDISYATKVYVSVTVCCFHAMFLIFSHNVWFIVIKTGGF